MKKRILSMLLVIVMVIGLLPTVAQAAAGFSVTTKVLSGGGSLSHQNNLQSGQTVTLQPIPDQGYGVYSIEAEDRYHNRIQLTDLGNGCYTFTMPSCDVSVKVEFAKPVGSVGFLSNGKFTLEMGKTLDLKEKIYFSPVVYLPTRLTWSSDNNSVATVDSDGNVTAVGEGVANITATAIDGTKTDGVSPSGSCRITVKKTSTITFDTDGGTTIAPITKAVGESFSVANPTKDGYTFAGREPALPRYMPEENTTYTAQWTAKQYTITQDPNTINGTLYFAKDYKYDEPVTAAAQGDTIAVFWEHAEGYVLDYETDISVRTEAGDAVEVESFEFTMPSDNVIVSASFVLEDYVIGVAASESGKAEADKETAHMGDTVTVTATPDTGYVVKRVTVTPVYNDGPEPCSLEEEGGEEPEEIAVTDKGDGTYSFIMPASNVAVNVEFELLAYDVWVGGVQITGANKDDITAAITAAGGNATGTATYDPVTNTLTLNNFSHTSEGYKFNPRMGSASIYATLEHLTVNFVGSNTVACSAENGYALYNYGALTITADDTNGSLALTGDYYGIQSSGDIIISDCRVTAQGNNGMGIAGNGTIAITNSFVTANGARHGIAVVHAEEDDATEMKSDDLTITNSTVVATGGEYALFYDGGHNEDESSIRGGLIPKLVFDNKFAAVAGNDAESAVMVETNAAATYENKHVRIVSVHDVTYKADGQIVGKVTVEHGKNATAPEIPAKEGYNETAPKWDKDGKNITADTEINAVYTKNQPGEYADVTPDTNVGGGKVAEEIEELKEKVPFTQEEEKQIEYGADVEVWLEIKDISDSVSSEEKAKVEEKLGDADVALYLDIAMFKQVGENEASRLTQLGDRVQICFKLDDSYINTDKDVTRTYSIIHVHDGKAEVITPVFDANAKTLSFQTDRFSTYALVYTDVVNTPPAEIPATGDSFQPAFWIACMTLSIFGIAVLLLDAKRRHAR